MLKYSFSETRKLVGCQRCGGQLIRSYDDIGCLQCGAEHTENGELTTYTAQELMVQFDTWGNTPQATPDKGKRSRRAHHWTQEEINMVYA